MRRGVALFLLAILPAVPQNLQLDFAEISLGSGIYSKNCANLYCHGAGGDAGQTPALVGQGWDRERIDRAVRKGVQDTNMPGWEGKLPPVDIQAVVTYVWSLQRLKTEQERLAPNRASLAHPGRALFFDATRVGNCGACHRVDGWGIPVAPVLPPPETVAALRAFSATSVAMATTPGGERFPAWRVESTDESVRVYDLSSTLPVLRAFQAGRVRLADGGEWSHDEVLGLYEDDELNQVLSFLGAVAARE